MSDCIINENIIIIYETPVIDPLNYPRSSQQLPTHSLPLATQNLPTRPNSFRHPKPILSRSFIHLLTHPTPIHSFIHSFMHSFIQSLFHPSRIHSFTRPFSTHRPIPPLSNSLTYSLT